MAARLKDVAALAGVSIKTASNVINDYPHIRPSTRAKVERAIEELRYRPNLSARQLKHGRAGFLALAVPHLDSPYFSELAARISAEADRLGRIVLLDITGGHLEAERLVAQGMRSHTIDGLIFSPLALDAEELAARSDDVPMVLLGERDAPPGYDHVAVDSVAAADAMVTHLIELGRTRIAPIGHEVYSGTSSVRLSGHRKALARHGLELPEELVTPVDSYDLEAGYRAMQRLLALPEPPDAVFCFADTLAFGALRACADAGVRVPQDVAVGGFDDISEARFSNPRLTTISHDFAFLTAEVLRLVLARQEGSDEPPARVHVPWQLVVRESTVGVGE
ncbi:LacI family DNA-binding transcriptional regulator [Propionibacteriaceae bacterium Y1700]|uniref:LacI family DNA-binding transcriptional regulator n=1 Tax=Microlunatus sp. Y1700 TaxID=3418487 RepID=UPI003DA716EF